jgi:glutaredoxin-like protein
MIPLRDQESLRQRFKAEITSRVRVDFFMQKKTSFYVPGRQDCQFCEEIQTLLEELASLNDRISLTVHDFDQTAQAAQALGVDKVPAIVIRGVTNRPVRYFGIPSGTEFPAFVDTLVDASRGSVDLKPATVRQLRKVKSEIELQVLVSTGCPHSPSMARTAFKFGLQSNRFKVDVIEVGEFPSLIQRYGLRAVPTTIIQDKIGLPGAMDEGTLLETALKVIEGKPLSGQVRTGPATPLKPSQPASQPGQNQPVRSSGGLILPR